MNLFIDASADFVFMALENNNIEIARYVRKLNSDLSTYLIYELDQLLLSNHTLKTDIKKIFIGNGPGSYTGIRLITTFAKMLSYYLRIKLFKISSLFFLSSGYTSALAFLDARNQNAYCLYHEDSKIIHNDDFLKLTTISTLFPNVPLVCITIDTIKIDYKKIKKNAVLVKDVFFLEPNYIRKSQAEQLLNEAKNER